MKRAASIIVNEPITFTRDELDQLQAAATSLKSTLFEQPPGYRGMVAMDVLKLYRIVNASIKRGREQKCVHGQYRSLCPECSPLA